MSFPDPKVIINESNGVGNCNPIYMIKALHNGWKVKHYYQRVSSNYAPLFMTKRETFQYRIDSFWIYWNPNMNEPKHIPESQVPFYATGWNHIVFEVGTS